MENAEKKRKYILIDNYTLSASKNFLTMIVELNNDSSALLFANTCWNALTKNDQKKRTSFYLLKVTDEKYNEAVENDEAITHRGQVLWSAI